MFFTHHPSVELRRHPVATAHFITSAIRSAATKAFMSMPPVFWDFACGGLASAMAVGVVHPLDTVKSRLQVVTSSPTPMYTTILSASTHIRRHEGVRAFYRGLSANVTYLTVACALRFAVYGTLCQRFVTPDSPYVHSFLCAVTAGTANGLLLCPLYRAKSILQTHAVAMSGDSGVAYARQCARTQLPAARLHVSPVAVAAESGSLLRTLCAVWAEGGPCALFRGVTAHVPRVAIMLGVQLSLYDTLKPAVAASMSLSSVATYAVASAGASLAAVFAMAPFDTVAVRYMTQGSAGGRMRYASVGDCWRQTLRAEGLRGLFRGTCAQYARVCPQYVLTYVAYEALRSAVGFHSPSGVRLATRGVSTVESHTTRDTA
eukprot:TRINITY_DN24238_c0_g1_i1.p1 TRINITY_DN24238_c0_g1~~TRINITY_DN24238_c0_g1_i1.p1  ORF type:complete len:375 (+),score=56.65 TRINITY_DN24238_c0_g1_i1:224-1348(+)